MSQMVFYKYPLTEDEVYDGTTSGSTYAYGVANPELFDGVPADLELILDDQSSDWYALSQGTMVAGPFQSVDEAFESVSSMYGADDWAESDEGYDEAQSELTVASLLRRPTAAQASEARSRFGVDIDTRTMTVAGTRRDIGRWRRHMAGMNRRVAADAGWLELEPSLWEYQDGREQAYIMDANDGLLHLYYEGLDYGPYEDEYMAMEVFSRILPPVRETIDRALSNDDRGYGPYIDGDYDNMMLDDGYDDDFNSDEFDPDDDCGFHDVSDRDDDYDDEGAGDEGHTASVHTAAVTHLLDDDVIMYDDDSPYADPDGVRVTRVDGDTIRVDADDDETYRLWLRMYGVDNPADVELHDEDERLGSARTAGAWRIEADAPLNNDQRRMLNDAGVAFSQDEGDDGKALITLTGTDKVVADTAEMIGLTDDFVNDAEPLDGGSVEDDGDPVSDVEESIDSAVESDGDDMKPVSDEDQRKIVDGVKSLLEGWKDEVADRSAARRADAPGADGTSVDELPVDDRWPYRFESRRVDFTDTSDVSASCRRGHALTQISVPGGDGRPVSISITMDKDYDTEYADYILESDDDAVHADDFWARIEPKYDPNDDCDYEDRKTYPWSFGSKSDGQLYSGEGETFEEAEDALYGVITDWFSMYVPDIGRNAGAMGDGGVRTASSDDRWSFSVPGVGNVEVTLDKRQYDSSADYLFNFGGAVDGYGKRGFQPVVHGRVEDVSFDGDEPEYEWSLYDDDHTVDESGEAASFDDAERRMLDAFDSFVGSSDCARMIRGYVDANR